MATSAAVPGIAGPGPARGVGLAGPGARWGALSTPQRPGEVREAELGAGSPAGGEPLPRPRGERPVCSERGVSSFSSNGKRYGLP